MRIVLVVLGLCMVLSCGARAADGDAIVGYWLAQDKDAAFEIARTGDTYEGRIVWLKDPVYDSEDKEAGKPVHDRNNPDAARRDDPMIGLRLLHDFQNTGENTWGKGVIYNPDDGRTYKCKIKLDKEGKLRVRGYVGISLLGGTTIWTPCEKPQPGQAGPPAPRKLEGTGK